MRTEEVNRLKDKSVQLSLTTHKANLVETGGSSKEDRFKGKGKAKAGQGQTKGQNAKKAGQGKFTKPASKNQKPNLVCYVCGKTGHKAYQCPQKKVAAEANVAEKDDIIAAVVVEANLVENASDWILDTGASRHLCANKDLFAEFEDVADGECVYMGNSSSHCYHPKGKIFLKLTSGKTLALNNVLYVPTLRRNLVSGALLNKAGVKLVFEADKVVMSRNGDFVSKGYLCEGLFVLNVDSPIINNNASTSAYFAESIDKETVSLPDAPVVSTVPVNPTDSSMHASTSTSVDHAVEQSRSKRPKIEKSYGSDFVRTDAIRLHLSEVAGDICAFDELVSAFLIEDDPKTYDEAMRSIDVVFWKEAIKNELYSIVSNQTWELTDLLKEIYMLQPEGFVVKGQESKVYKLRKSLYGLKQAPKQWYEKFHNTLTDDGYITNNSDSCVYSKMFGSDCVIICLYVDDMLILVLKKFNSFDVTPARTPYDASISLCKNLGDSVSQEEYAKIIGSVMFLMNYTRPDIAYAVSRLSRYIHNPSAEHWNALRRLLKYLKGTIDLCLHYGNDEIHSTSGYVFTLGGGAISWKSAKQTCIASSTMESEFIALELAGQEADWLRNLLADVPMWGDRLHQSPFSVIVKQLSVLLRIMSTMVRNDIFGSGTVW
ncbi:uncharacterized protein LOC141588800 [Silene latifolia]|uniref:uncharacterized protein LOC141588800 n=1 Tax=Silene latifolia TaxID=37657 RepID=UPI003D77EB13